MISKRREEYLENPKICLKCKSIISYEHRENAKFCSRSCGVSFNNIGKRKHGKPPVIRKCRHCNKTIKGKFFCSVKCGQDNLYKNFIKAWLDGEQSGTCCGESKIVSSYVRRWMFETRNNKCEECGWAVVNKKSGKIPLQIDHIDGDFSNNKFDNLRLLCPNCHSLTPTFCSLNRGMGRKSRREAKGISL